MINGNKIKTVLVITLLMITGFAFNVAAGEMMIVAHRGASREAPQNTIPAFINHSGSFHGSGYTITPVPPHCLQRSGSFLYFVPQ